MHYIGSVEEDIRAHALRLQRCFQHMNPVSNFHRNDELGTVQIFKIHPLTLEPPTPTLSTSKF